MQTRLWWRLRWGLTESAFGCSLKSGVRRSDFCWGFAVKTFSHLIYFIETFYKFCTFNASCKDNAAINFITVQHEKGPFQSTLTGNTYYATIGIINKALSQIIGE
jgi:hypothetical protein